MMKNRRRYILTILIMIVTIIGFRVEGAQPELYSDSKEIQNNRDDSGVKEEVLEEAINLFDWQTIHELENKLQDEAPKGIRFDTKQLVTDIISGKIKVSIEEVIVGIGGMLFGEIGAFINIGARFFLIVLLCNLLETLSSSFKSKDTLKVGFLVCYITIILSVIQSFVVLIEIATSVIDNLCSVMYVCIPMLLAFMGTTGYAVSAAAMAPVIITGLSIITYFIKVCILPVIIWIIILELISSMSETFKVDQFIKLFYKGVKWVLGSISVLSLGILSIYRLTLPLADMTVKKAALKFSTAFIPVVGGAVSGTAEFLMGCSELIKNAFSAGVIVWLLVIVSIPLIKILAYILVYQIAGAIIQPLGDKKMALVAQKLGKGCQFVMSIVGIIAMLCVCSLAICMSVGFGVV